MFAARAEHYSKVKNDPELNVGIINDALEYGMPSVIIWHESTIKNRFYKLINREPFEKTPKQYMAKFFSKTTLDRISFKSIDRHKAIALGAVLTSQLDAAAILIVDDSPFGKTISIWGAIDTSIKQVYSKTFPNSLGLFSRLITQRIGGQPYDQKRLMDLAGYGRSNYSPIMIGEIFNGSIDHDFEIINQDSWRPELKSDSNRFNIAASAQEIIESGIINLAVHAKILTGSENLIYSGSMTTNIVANSTLASAGLFKKIWIPPMAGDGSVGAALSISKTRHRLKTIYLGKNLYSTVTPEEIVDRLLSDGIVCVAHGKTEFSTFSHGNRAIFVNPTNKVAKEKLDAITNRKKNTAYSCSILQERTSEFFIVPQSLISPHMQYAMTCRFYDEFPAICRVDGTARVQTVSVDNPVLYEILKIWEEKTTQPLLLTASLKTKSGTLVNSTDDIAQFESDHSIRVLR